MFVIRDIFNTKPGRAKDLVAKMKKALPLMGAPGMQSARVMTDTVAGYWTVVCETEVEDLKTYFDMGASRPQPRGRRGHEGLHGPGQRRPPRDLPDRVRFPGDFIRAPSPRLVDLFFRECRERRSSC